MPDRRERHALLAWLEGTALPAIVARPGMVGAVALENDLEVANAPLRDKSMDHPRANEVEWVVLLEGGEASAAGAAARSVFTMAKLAKFGVAAAPSIGTYRLLFGNQR